MGACEGECWGWVQVIFLRGLDKQLLLSRQFKYSRYYLRLFEAAFAKNENLEADRTYCRILLSQHNPLPV